MRFLSPLKKNVIYCVCYLISSFNLFAQTGGTLDDIPWSYHNTGVNMFVYSIGSYSNPNNAFDGEQMTAGSAIGAFYEDENGVLQCAGYTEINSNPTIAIPVFSDNPDTEAIDGIVDGVPMIFMYWDVITGNEYMVVADPDEPVYFSNVGFFYVDGFAASSAQVYTSEGCTDETALNYDPLADEDDGSCEMAPDCSMSPPASNDGTCQYYCNLTRVESIYLNEEGMIEMLIEDNSPDNYLESSFVITNDVGDILAQQEYVNAGNLPIESLQILQPIANTESWSGTIYVQLYVGNGAFMACEESYVFNGFGIAGCTEESATNYDDEVTIDDGTCFYLSFGCTDPSASNYNPNVFFDDGTCEYGATNDWSYTQTDVHSSILYDWGVLLDGQEVSNGSVIGVFMENEGELICVGSEVVGSFNDGYFYIYQDDPSTEVVDGYVVGQEMIYMVWDIDTDQEYVAVPEGFIVQSFQNDIVYTVEQFTSNTNEVVSGCTDVYSLNYNALADSDDGSCLYGNATCEEGEELVSLVFDQGYYSDGIAWTVTSEGQQDVEGVDDMQFCVQAGDYSIEVINDFSQSWSYGYFEFDVYIGNNNVLNGVLDLDNQVVEQMFVVGSSGLGNSESGGENIYLPSGWSSFCLSVIPEDQNIVVVLDTVIDKVVIVKNYLGQAYLPEWGFNGIGDVVVGQGYQIKTTESCLFTVYGEDVAPEDNPVELVKGWNLIGYLRSTPAYSGEVVQDLVASDNLVIVKDYLGNAYLPEWAFNGLGDMLPNHAYQFKVNEAATLHYLSNDEVYRLASSDIRIEKKLTHYPIAMVTDNNMQVVITDEAWEVVPKEGDELAAFDKNGVLIGSAVYSSPVTVLTVWGDDTTTPNKDGLTTMEVASFQLWSEGKTRTFEVVEWLEGSSSYNVNAVNVAALVSTEAVEESMNLYEAVPNPSNTKTKISFFTSEETHISIVVYNVLGEVVKELVNANFEEGKHSIEMDVAQFEPGVYFYHMESGAFAVSKRLSVVK